MRKILHWLTQPERVFKIEKGKPLFMVILGRTSGRREERKKASE